MNFLQRVTKKGEEDAKNGDYKSIAEALSDINEMLIEDISTVTENPEKKMNSIKEMYKARDRLMDLLND